MAWRIRRRGEDGRERQRLPRKRCPLCGQMVATYRTGTLYHHSPCDSPTGEIEKIPKDA